MLAVLVSIAISCNMNPAIDSKLNDAEGVMNQFPDSALTILSSIDNYTDTTHPTRSIPFLIRYLSPTMPRRMRTERKFIRVLIGIQTMPINSCSLPEWFTTAT